MDIGIGIKVCASAICGHCCTAEMWDWGGEHIAQRLWHWTRLTHWSAHAMKHETCPSSRRVWLVQAYRNLTDMQESKVCLFLRYLIASSVFDDFCAWTGLDGHHYLWQQGKAMLKLHKCWWRRCQHWSHGQGTVGGKCILVNNSWMVAMWSGEHPLGLLTAYANEGVGRWSGHGRSLEFWHSYTKMAYFECPSIVTQLCHGLWWMKVQEVELEWQLQIKRICFDMHKMHL